MEARINLNVVDTERKSIKKRVTYNAIEARIIFPMSENGNFIDRCFFRKMKVMPAISRVDAR